LSITLNVMIGFSFSRVIVLVLFLAPMLGSAQIRVLDQRTEYLATPLAIDTDRPRFTWKMQA
jgi:hypothetical protein